MSVHTIIEKHRIENSKKQEELKKLHEEQLERKFKEGFVMGAVFGSIIGTLSAYVMNEKN